MNNIPMTPVMLKLLNFIKKYVKKKQILSNLSGKWLMR
jgi:hypothetical protein